jgi:transposase
LVVEVPVYGWEKLVLLKHLLDQGLTKTAIAAQVGVSRRIVYHWIQTGQLDRDLTQPVPRTRGRRVTKLDPYKPIIDTRLGTYPELSAVRLFAEVQGAGYGGGITQLRDYVLQVRPRPEPEPVVRFETLPGLQAQVDFADFKFPWGKRHALLVVLGYSRLLWLTFYPRQTMRTLMAGLETAFTYMGGVPRELLFDQLKAVIIDDQRPQDGKLIENPEFLRFAAHWGFRIRACRPYRAQTKGKVERPVGYVRGNFVYGREFLGDADLAAQAAAWLEAVANVRCHGTTGEAPRLRFERDERAVLLPLAARPYQPLVPLLPRRARGASPRLDIPVERRPLETYAALLEAV